MVITHIMYTYGLALSRTALPDSPTKVPHRVSGHPAGIAWAIRGALPTLLMRGVGHAVSRGRSAHSD